MRIPSPFSSVHALAASNPLSLRADLASRMDVQQIRIIRLKDVLRCTGLSRSSIYKFIEDGHFPKSVPLGIRSVGWIESEVSDWIAERIEMRNEALSK